MGKQSAGILAWQKENGTVKVLLVHPGGPFFAKKDLGAWSIPKGEFSEDEQALEAARREFREELGIEISGEFFDLNAIKQKSGKTVYAWAVETKMDISDFSSNTFSLEWPPHSGKTTEYPEVDKAEWVTLDRARIMLNPAQVPFIDQLDNHLKINLL